MEGGLPVKLVISLDKMVEIPLEDGLHLTHSLGDGRTGVFTLADPDLIDEEAVDELFRRSE